jgi:hypothetical protein
MASPRSSTTDLPLALVLLAAGVTSIAVASARSPVAFHFLPSMDGCLTAGCVGFCLALIAGAPFRQALLLLLPIVGVQTMGARVHDASFLAVFGIEALVVGLVGTVLALRAHPVAPTPTPTPTPRPLRARRAHPLPAT